MHNAVGRFLMARARYGEGDWFAVPLRDSGFAIGIVARANRSGVLFGYFFGPRRASVPAADELVGFAPSAAILVGRFGGLGLKDGKWPVIGRLADWDRSGWPMPTFGRFEELTGRAFTVEYDDDDPNSQPRERQIGPEDLVRHPKDGLAGAGFIEISLTALLA
jgi:hypothetical protein